MLHLTDHYIQSRLSADRQFARRQHVLASAAPPTGLRRRVAAVLLSLGARLIPEREQTVMGRVVVLAHCPEESTTARAA